MHRYVLQFLCALAGFVVGYFLLHPYAMLVYFLTTTEQAMSWNAWSDHASEAFRSIMLPMAVSFAAFGGIIGFMIALLVERKRRLDAAAAESERNRVALEAVKNLMVTLSHYLLNANMIIGGKVRHCRKATTDEDILTALAVVEEQGQRIDAVIGALRNIVEMKTTNYTTDGRVAMFDIAGEIDRMLQEWHERKGTGD